MPIRLTNSDFEKAREQIDRVLYNTREGLTRQEKDWRGWAVGQEVSETAMKKRIGTIIQNHIKTLNLILTVKKDRAADWEGIKKLIGKRGGESDTQLETYANQYLTLLARLDKMPRDTWKQQIAICDVIAAEVVPPLLALWDE